MTSEEIELTELVDQYMKKHEEWMAEMEEYSEILKQEIEFQTELNKLGS